MTEPKTITVTAKTYSKNLNVGKFMELEKQAKELGKVRDLSWVLLGGLKAINLNHRVVRSEWMINGYKEDFELTGLTAKAWKETLRDCVNNINLYKEAAKEKVRKAIVKNKNISKEDRKRYFTLLKSDKWLEDPYLHRKMRQLFKHGKNHTHNQIIVEAGNYTWFLYNNTAYISIPSLRRGKRVKIPLTNHEEVSGTLRLILKSGRIEIHHPKKVPIINDCGAETIGLDKGYSEVFVDSNGKVYGENFGDIMTKASDKQKTKNARRNKLYAIAKNTKNLKKKNNILKNNLGKVKQQNQLHKVKSRIKSVIRYSVNCAIDLGKHIVVENLNFQPKSNKKRKFYSKNWNRRLNQWAKGEMHLALEEKTQRRGSSLHLVNAAYTSQCDSFCENLLVGRRSGDRFYCENGDVVQADYNAARNVLARFFDKEITLFMPCTQVRAILLKRTESYRLSSRAKQDSSYTLTPSVA